ncbi:MAG: cupin domain-containing protein [Pseudomonadales bacterium]
MGADHSVTEADTITEHFGVSPPPGGTVLRVIDLPPEDPNPEVRRRQMEESIKQLFPDAQHKGGERHPGMHVTDTVDYAILLEGEIVAIMESGETTMRAGDILIQRGTNHAWANRSDRIARMAFVLVDGEK